MNFIKDPPSRIIGLDTLRASAIALVMMSHYGFAGGNRTFGIFSDIGWAGVDLFFILSGYLIGNQLLSTFARGEPFSIPVFFARRLMRTLPNYYVILLLYWLLPWAPRGETRAPLWEFLTFTQNLGMHYGATFTHSWSLCIEEQFYLILPLAVMLIARFRKSLRLGWLVIAALIAEGMHVRGAAWFQDGRDAMDGFSFSGDVYYSSFARFDELLLGVGIAMLKNFHPALFERILRRGNALLAGGLILASGALYWFNVQSNHTLPLLVLGYPLLGSGFALMTLAGLSAGSLLNRIRVPGAPSLALWSYAVYLAHKPIYQMAAEPAARLGLDANSLLGIVILTGAGIAGGWILFILVETPFMKLRTRWFPSASQRTNGRADSNALPYGPSRTSA